MFQSKILVGELLPIDRLAASSVTPGKITTLQKHTYVSTRGYSRSATIPQTDHNRLRGRKSEPTRWPYLAHERGNHTMDCKFDTGPAAGDSILPKFEAHIQERLMTDETKSEIALTQVSDSSRNEI